MGDVAYLGIIGDISRFYQFHVNHALLLHTVGKILDILRAEEIVALVADGIGDIDAHGTQRVQAIAAARLQVMVDTGQRVHKLQYRLIAFNIADVTQRVRRVHIDIIGYLGLLGVTARN